MSLLEFWGISIICKLEVNSFRGMKNVLFLLLIAFLSIFSIEAISSPSLDIQSSPVQNNGFTGPSDDPSASMGQWFFNLRTAGIESRTYEFYDNPSIIGDQGVLSINGVVTDLIKGG